MSGSEALTLRTVRSPSRPWESVLMLKSSERYCQGDSLGDRWSHYMTAEEYTAYRETMSNSYVGIGVTISVRDCIIFPVDSHWDTQCSCASGQGTCRCNA